MTQNILLLLNTFYTYLVRINCSLSFRFRNNLLMLGDRVSISIRETKYSLLTMWTLEITSAQFTRRNWNLKTLPHHLLKCVISTLISRLAKTHPSVSASMIRERTLHFALSTFLIWTATFPPILLTVFIHLFQLRLLQRRMMHDPFFIARGALLYQV